MAGRCVRLGVRFKVWQPLESEWVFAAQCVQCEEKQRIGEFVFKKDAKAAMVGRLLMRKVIADLTGIPYKDIVLGRTEKGKPVLRNPLPEELSDFSFNVSHQGDYAVIAANTDRLVGVDIMKVEPRSRSVDEFFSTMQRQLTSQEWQTVKNQTSDMLQLKMFYRHWCLKESLVKALGIGIGFEVGRLDFRVQTLDLCASEPVLNTTVHIDGQLSQEWVFEESMLDDHCVVVAVKCSPEQQMADLKERFEKMKMDRVKRYEGVNLYVKNLDDVIDDDRLRKEFSQFGNITSARVMCEGGRSKGFGFVCFSSPEAASKAINEMNGHIIVSKPLYVALAQRKEDRRAHLASQYMQRMTNMQQQPQQQPVQSVPAYNQSLYQPTGAEYFTPTIPAFVPAVPQPQRAYFAPAAIPQVPVPVPSWQIQVQPNQPTAGFQTMPGCAIRSPLPGSPSPIPGSPGPIQMWPGMNAQPITDQAPAAAVMAGPGQQMGVPVRIPCQTLPGGVPCRPEIPVTNHIRHQHGAPVHQQPGQQPVLQQPPLQQPLGQPHIQQSLGQPHLQQSLGQPHLQQSLGQPHLQQSLGQPYLQQLPGHQPVLQQSVGQHQLSGQQHPGQQHHVQQQPGQQSVLQQPPGQPHLQHAVGQAGQQQPPGQQPAGHQQQPGQPSGQHQPPDQQKQDSLQFTIITVQELLKYCQPLPGSEPDVEYWNKFSMKLEAPNQR